MTLLQILYVSEVAKAGSISQAAQNLYMAQPNLSTAIHQLERELNITLFYRTAKGIRLTEEGNRFMAHAGDILARVDALQSLRKGETSSTAVFSLTTTRSSEITATMAQYANQMEGRPYRIKLKEGTNYDVISDVSSHVSDVGIVRVNTHDHAYFRQLIAGEGLNSITLPAVPYVLLFSKTHPLAQAENITQDMLAPYVEVIHGDYKMPMYPFSENQPRQRTEGGHKSILFVYERGTLMDLLSHVEGSYVWTTTTHQDLKTAFQLVERTCDAPPVEGFDIVVHRTDTPLKPEAQAFLDLLLRQRGMTEETGDA